MDIDADMAASSRPRNGLAEKLAAHCPACLCRLEDCMCRRAEPRRCKQYPYFPGTSLCIWPECDCPSHCGPVYTMRAPGPFEIPDYRDLPPGAKVLTASFGDMLYVPLPEDAQPITALPSTLAALMLAALMLAVGILVGYVAAGVWG